MQLYFEGQRLRVVAWHDGRAVYWLVNTLQNILTNRQMLAIAAAARPVPLAVAPRSAGSQNVCSGSPDRDERLPARHRWLP